MMLAQIGKKELLTSKDFIFEPKLDGFRALLEVKNKKHHLISRGAKDITNDFPELKFDIDIDCTIDGEIVAYDEFGNPSFSLMQTRESPAKYVAFDVISFKGKSVKDLPLEERKNILKKIIENTKNDSLQLISYTQDGLALWNIMIKRRLEGVIAKKKASTYVDSRSNNWIKIKNELTADCVIVGYITKVREIASLSLAVYEKNELKYIGQVGTGFNEKFLASLIKKLKPAKPAKNEIGIMLPKNVISVHPNNVCEVKYLMFTKDHRLRAPVFLRLREDKMPRDCTIDQLIPI